MRRVALIVFLFGAALCTRAQTTTTAPPMPLSLYDCIEMALSQNIDLQIARYNPEIALYALRAAYGAYDPSLVFSGQHSHSESGSTLLGGGFSVPGSTTDRNSFSGGLQNGLTPWGMTYSLQGNASDTYGTSFSVVSNSIVPRSFENASGSASATVTQPLLRNFWIDGARLSIRLNRIGLRASELDLKYQVMQTITVLEQAYYNLIYARENVIVQQKAVELANQLVTENRKRVEVGAMAPLDAKQAESQAASSQAGLIAALSDLAAQENVVKRLISSNFSDIAFVSLEPTGGLTAPERQFNLHESWRKGLEEHPLMIRARLAVEQAGIQLKYDRNQLFPQLDIFATYGYNGAGSEFSGTLFQIRDRDLPYYTYGGQISIPLAHQRERNNYKASKVSLQQAVLTLKNTEQERMRLIDDDIKRAQAAFERVAATRAAREYAEEALAAEQKKLEQGKSTTYTVLQMQRDLTAARGSEIQALATYNNSLSQLSLDEGTTLDRLNIDFETRDD